MKKKLTITLLLFILIATVGCTDKTNYQDGYSKGYAEGFQTGQSKGDIEGFDRGQKTGYSEGYKDGFAKSGKELAVTTITIANLTGDTLVTFGTIVAYVFLALIFSVIITCLFIGGFGSKSAVVFSLAKMITVFIAGGCAYALMLYINLNTILFFKIEGVFGVITNAVLFFVAIWFCSFMYTMLSARQPYLIIFIIFLFTFIGFYFSLFLTDINTYILKNHFILWSIFWIIMGSLSYVVFKLVDVYAVLEKGKPTEKNKKSSRDSF